jgi:hypothetical protein
MIPKILIKNETRYRFIKEYNDYALYQNEKIGTRECFSKFSLGLIKEKVKPEREANRGGMCKH